MTRKDFYVYLYLREDKTPYYVGKGSGRRDKEKHACPVPNNPNNLIRVATHLTERGAWNLEKQLISYYGRESEGGLLVNKSSGGAGGSRWTQTEESKLKRSKSHLLLKRVRTQAERDSISKTRKGITPHNKGVRGVYHFKPCVYRGEQFKSVSEASRRFGVSVTAVSKACKKRQASSYYV